MSSSSAASNSSAQANPRLDELARQHDLGEFLQRHPAFKEATKASIWYALGGLGMMAYAVFGNAVGFEMPAWALALVFACGLLLGGFGCVSIARLLSLEVQLHRAGLVYKRLGGIDVVPYRDLVGVLVDVTTTRHVQSGTSSRHGKILAVLRAGNGPSRRVRISPDLEDVESFAGAFVGGAAEHVVANVLAEVRAGRRVDCGAFELTPAGVEAQGEVLAYSGKLRAWVDSSHVSVKAGKSQEVKVRKSKVLNAPYLETVIRAMDPTHRERVILP